MKRLIFFIVIAISSTYSQNWFIQTNWQDSSTTLNSISFINPQTGYVVGSVPPRVYKTTNGGNNWIRMGIQDTIIQWIMYSVWARDTSTIYIGSILNRVLFYWNGLFFPLMMNGWDIPSHWTAVTGINGIPYAAGVTYGGGGGTTIAWGPNFENHFYAGQYSFEIYRLRSGIAVGEHGLVVYSPAHIVIVDSNANFTGFDPINGFVCGGSYFYQSTNGGYNWSRIYPLSNATYYDVKFFNSSTGWVSCNLSDGTPAMIRTTNGGQSWIQYWNGTSGTGKEICFVNDTLGWVVFGKYILKGGNPPPVYHTVSGQVRYQDNNQIVISGKVKALRYNRNLNQIITVDSVEIQPNGTYSLLHVTQDSTYVMAFDNRIVNPAFVPTYNVSTINWQNASVICPSANLDSINIKVYRATNSSGLLHIGGSVFSNSLVNFIGGLSNALIFAKVGNAYRSYSTSGYFGSYRIDSISSGTYDLIVDRIGYYPLSRSVVLTTFNQDTINFYMNMVITSLRQTGSLLPVEFSLSQNYPNPFNPTTKIKFDIPSFPLLKGARGMPVRLTIYDILGREVATLLNEQLQPGTYEVEWDGTNYPSGVYFYKLQTESFSETKRMVLIK